MLVLSIALALDVGVQMPVVSAASNSKDPKRTEKALDSNTLLLSLAYFKNSSIALALVENNSEPQLLRSKNEGAEWIVSDLVSSSSSKLDMPLQSVFMHDKDTSRAYLFTADSIYMTVDRLDKHLEKINTPSKYNQLSVPALDYHPVEPDYLVFVGSPRGCPDPAKCYTEAYITLDSGKTWENDNKPIETWATKCLWAWDSKFGGDDGGTGSSYTDRAVKLGKDAVYCTSFKYKNGHVGQDQLGTIGSNDNPIQLVLISNKGKDRRVLIDRGVISFYVVESLLVVAVDIDHELRIMVSTDGETFVNTKFPPNLNMQREAFTMLESGSGGVYMDVSQSNHFLKEYGTLFKSNSNGTFYSRIMEHTNRKQGGKVDFDKMKGIPGIVLVNQVTNIEEMASSGRKKIKTKISFDSGASWDYIKPPSKDSDGNDIKCSADDGCSLNIILKEREMGSSRSSVHTSAAAAGIMVAVGNIGKELLSDYNSCSTYLTKDAGRSWIEIKSDAHKWVIGDHGGLIVLINDEMPTKVLSFSLDYGTTWSDFIFTDTAVRVEALRTEPASTSLKVLIVTKRSKASGRSFEMLLISVDFSESLPRICEKKNDLVVWTPIGEDGKDRCFLGQEVEFYRKKKGVDCYIGREFDMAFGELGESCVCTEKDFECDFNFFLDPVTHKCKMYIQDPLRPTNCKPGETYKGSSGYRKIAVSKCKGGKDLTAPVDRSCDSVDGGNGEGGGTASKDIKLATNFFKHKLANYFYFNQTQTVIIRDEAGRIWKSEDAGRQWTQPMELKSLDVDRIILDPHRSGHRAYFLSVGENFFHYTDDAAKSIKKVILPSVPNRLGVEPLVVHADDAGYLIFIGESKDCAAVTGSECRTEVYVSSDTGYRWSHIAQYAQKCIFGRDVSFRKPPKDSIYCQVFDTTSGNQRSEKFRSIQRKLIKSSDFGKNFETVLSSTVGFAISHEYMVSATLPKGESQLRLFVSTDGSEWMPAVFENDEQIPDFGYTLLDSSSGSVFLQVFSSRHVGAEYGALYRSINNNGTMFKISLEHVNQDASGFTDFEKIIGVTGIGIANEVVNYDNVRVGSPKKIRTKITFNDGEKWSELKPPSSFDCNFGDCYLNLHHFTERTDANDLFSSASAIGFMMGVGNVGAYLTTYNEGDTFLTKDAGRTWKEVAKDAHLYEFGNRGGVILLANNEGAIDGVKYSLDHGNSFIDLRISDGLGAGAKLRVTNIITEPYGSASSFIVFGTLSGGPNHGEVASVQLDFSAVWSRACKMDLKNDAESDFEKWSPTSGSSSASTCVFGEQVEYYRRKADRICKSPETFEMPKRVIKQCDCTLDDYECDANYIRNSTGHCAAKNGFVPPLPTCVNGRMHYNTGYLRSKKSHCSGGLQLESHSVEYCASSISFFGWFFIILLAVSIPAAISYCMFMAKKGGRIRLTVDSDGLFASVGESASFSEKIIYSLKAAGVVIMELGEVALSSLRQLYDWARERLVQGSGYSRVHSSPLDDAIDHDRSLQDLDDDEDA